MDSVRNAPAGHRPRLAVVLLFLTATVALFAYRIHRGARPLPVDVLAREAIRIHAAGGAAGQEMVEPEVAAARLKEMTGAELSLPGRDEGFEWRTPTRERLGKRPAAGLRFSRGGGRYLLIVLRTKGAGAASPGALWSEEGFLSGARGETSFVYWERGGTIYLLVSDRDLTETIGLVREHFT